nr:serine/threonine protein kinase SRPK1 [Tanacetum cinerariifolium]
MTESPFLDYGFDVLVFSLRDDLIACLNKAMAFLTAIASLSATSSGETREKYSGTTYKSNATSSKGNTASGQARVVKCYNYQCEGHMARQCTQPKRPRNVAWYKEKAMPTDAQEAGQTLDEEQLTFLVDLGITASQAHTIIPHNAAFQTEDLDTYDSNCDDLSTTQAILMANISNYGSNIISEVPKSETYLNDIDSQSNSQVKDNKIGLLVQQYEQFIISEDESIDSDFARFNTIITSLKALDEGYSSKNYVRKFLRDLHHKWRAKVMVIEESKNLTSLSLDELIGNLKVHEMIIKKDSKIVKEKVERKSIALKAKKESSDEECSTPSSEDEEYAMTSGKSDKKCFRCGDPNHLIGECPKPPKDKNQRAFAGGSWSDSGEEDDEKVKDEMCLVAHASSEICLGFDLKLDERIKDSECSKHMTGNRKLFPTYKAYNGGNVIFGSNLYGNIIDKGQIRDNKCRVTFSKLDSEITKDGKVIGKQAHTSHKAKNVVSTTGCLELLHKDLFGPSTVRSYGGNRYTLVIVDDYSSKAYIVLSKHNKKVKESLNVTFDKTPPPFKTSPLVDDDLDEDEAIKVVKKKNLENNIVEETLEIDKIVNIKESRNHPLENVIGNLNQRTLRSQAQKQSNIFCFISTIEPMNVNEALGDGSWIVAMQEELNQFVANNV